MFKKSVLVFFSLTFLVLLSSPSLQRPQPPQASAASYIYYVEINGGVGRADLSNPVPEPLISLYWDPVYESYMRQSGVAVDREFIYFANLYGDIGWGQPGTTISRANLDGSGIDYDYISGCSCPSALALDDKYIYWTNLFNHTIGRATLDGTTEVIQNFIDDPDIWDTHGLAVCGNYIYWTDCARNSIGRANINGGDINPLWITTYTAAPHGVAVTDTHVYWTNPGLQYQNTIGRAEIGGQNPEIWITGAEPMNSLPLGIAVKGDFIYWANHSNNFISRARLDGTGYEQKWLENVANTTYVAFTPDMYVFEGFFSPIDNPPTVNKVKAGQTIPIKWKITDMNGLPVSDPASFIGIQSSQVPCDTFTGGTNDVTEPAAGSSGLQYLGNGYWQYNWKTSSSYAGQCRIMTLRLGDHRIHTASFNFK